MEMTQQTFTVEEANAQAEIYATLAALFTQKPDTELVANIRGMGEGFSLSFDQYRGLNDDVQAGLTELSDYLTQIEMQADEDVAQALLVDWTRLFRGLYANYGPKPPYETLWHGPGGESVEIMRAISQQYRQFGLTPVHDHSNRLDFLGMECDFIRFLFQKMAAALAAGDESQADHCYLALCRFFGQHIAPWAVDYCSQAAEAAQTSFYRGFLFIARGVFIQGIQ